MSQPRRSQEVPFVLAYSGGALADFRSLPAVVKDDAARVITKLAHGRIQGVPLPPLLDPDLAGTHRVQLCDQHAFLYRLHPAPASRQQFATASVISAGFDNQQLRERTLQHLRPAAGHVWGMTYTRDFLAVDLPALRQEPDLYRGMRQALGTIASPNPPRSHDPTASGEEEYLSAFSATGQTIRHVAFDTPERMASGAEPSWTLSFRPLRPPPRSRGNTLLIVQAAPTQAATTQRELVERLRLTNHRDPRVVHDNQQVLKREWRAAGRGQAGRSRSTTGSAPQVPPNAADSQTQAPARRPHKAATEEAQPRR